MGEGKPGGLERLLHGAPVALHPRIVRAPQEPFRAEGIGNGVDHRPGVAMGWWELAHPSYPRNLDATILVPREANDAPSGPSSMLLGQVRSAEVVDDDLDFGKSLRPAPNLGKLRGSHEKCHSQRMLGRGFPDLKSAASEPA